MKKAIVFLTVLAVLGLTRCSPVPSEIKPGRFSVEKEFPMFDGSYPNMDTDYAYGKIIKDRVRGVCYLYVWAGFTGHGGPAITRIDCE